ncbi:lipase-like protein [Desulfosarcina variabilis str. Montpellier]|uniref:golvesin C-terminal-like domain-containing protein n=1 Tax=Desulfosarcina variabilis TaxID=2300 RepID=UPI003AFA99DA
MQKYIKRLSTPFPFLILVFCFQISYAFADIIIDNGDAETSYTGTWRVSGGVDAWDPDDSSAVSLYSRDGATYTWTFTPTDSGDHDISMWWTNYSSRSDSIPVTIRHADGTDTVSINQQVNGGAWNLLGTYAFIAGTPYSITITSQPRPSSTCADAVKISYADSQGNLAPVAVIDSVAPNPALASDLVTFTGHGDDPDGSIAGFSWESDIDGHLSDLASFTTTMPLSLGTHTISLIVYDNEGLTSAAASQQLIVQESTTEWVIDNGDPETSYTGTWRVSGGTAPWDPADSNAVSLYSRDGSTYTYQFTPVVTGTFQVSMWWTTWSSRSENIPVTIDHSGGTDTVFVNQQVGSAMWNELGEYPFSAGDTYAVTITSQPAPSSTCADAVKFVYTGDAINLPPVATIDAITPPAAVPGTAMTFMGTGIDNEGSITAYKWESDLDGTISDQESFRTTGLQEGIHTIFFSVQDDQGVWSDSDTALITVRDCDRPVAIMPLGDSITLGYGEALNPDLMTGYRSPLHQALVADGFNIDFVGNRSDGLLVVPAYDIDHQGIGGISANSVADNVYNWLMATPPEVVLLHIGTNNFTTDPSAVEEILNEIDRYETNSGNAVAVILARIINRQPFHADTTIFNNNVQAMVQSRIAAGDKIIIVDQESVLNYDTEMADQLHPNNQGYVKMAGPWMDELPALVPECSEFTPFIFTTPVETLATGVEYAYSVAALGKPAPVFSLISAPDGMTINEVSGEISWVPDSQQTGESFAVTVRASNIHGSDDQHFTISVTEETIIIDNGDPETTFTGTWSTSGGSNPWDPADPNAVSLYSRDGTTYTWTFTPSTSGSYQLSMWWTEWSSRSNSVPVTIQHDQGVTTTSINQQTGGGMWNVIDTFAFTAGQSYDVTITSQPGPSSTCADAVKFVRY